MTETDPPLKLAAPLSAEEQEQLRQTIEMFEVITQANPQDTQSLEILKEAHWKIGDQATSLIVARRLADAYMDLGQYASALLEYEGILQKDTDNAEIIAALGEVEARLQAVQTANSGNGAGIALDFRSVVQEGGNLIATKKTQGPERISMSGAMDSAAVAARLENADDGNDALVRFLIQNKLASADVVNQARTIVRKKNKDRQPTQIASSLLDEIITRGQVDPEQLLCGILDRSKFAYIPLEHYDIDRQVVKMLPDTLTLGRLIVPFDILSRTMMIAVANPFDAAGKEAVQQLLDYNIQWHLASPAAILRVLTDSYKL